MSGSTDTAAMPDLIRSRLPTLRYRNFVNCKHMLALLSRIMAEYASSTVLLFHGFLLMVSYLKEKSDRQLFSLRTQLKLQYRYAPLLPVTIPREIRRAKVSDFLNSATQQAQISEKKANALSRRFVSYIFQYVERGLKLLAAFS